MLSQYLEGKTINLHKTKMTLEEEEEDKIWRINMCVISGKYGWFIFYFGFLSVCPIFILFYSKPFSRYTI
jgi:hypothetical protein